MTDVPSLPIEFVAPAPPATRAVEKAVFGYVEVGVPAVANDAAFGAMFSTFRGFFSNLVFRRVGSIKAENKNLQGMSVVTANSDGSLNKVFHSGEDVLAKNIKFPEQVFKQNVVEHLESFSFFTKPNSKGAPLYKSDPFPDKAIYGVSSRYAELDLLTLSFVPRKCNTPPRADEGEQSELVCGLVESGPKGPRYTCWFTCSEQFYRLVQLITEPGKYFDDIRKKRKVCDPNLPATEDPEMRAFFFAGNTISTNAYRRFLRACFDSSVVPDHEELQKRYWTHEFRTENYARCCHIYAALALILVWREWPCAYNVPNNNDLGPRVATWDLPDPQFIANLVHRYGISSNGVVVRKIKYVTNLPNVPVGTHLPVQQEVELVESHQESADRTNEVEVPYLNDANFPPLPNRNVQREE